MSAVAMAPRTPGRESEREEMKMTNVDVGKKMKIQRRKVKGQRVIHLPFIPGLV